jgi:hypothetical protein
VKDVFIGANIEGWSDFGWKSFPPAKAGARGDDEASPRREVEA